MGYKYSILFEPRKYVYSGLKAIWESKHLANLGSTLTMNAIHYGTLEIPAWKTFNFDDHERQPICWSSGVFGNKLRGILHHKKVIP